MYEDLIEAFQGIITDLCQYADKYRIDIQNRDRIHRIWRRLRNLLSIVLRNAKRSHHQHKINTILNTKMIQQNQILYSEV